MKEVYLAYQQKNGYPGLKAEQSGLVISSENPRFAASTDGVVYDPTYSSPKGLVKVKTPFLVKETTIKETHAMSKSFGLETTEIDDGFIVFYEETTWLQLRNSVPDELSWFILVRFCSIYWNESAYWMNT